MVPWQYVNIEVHFVDKQFSDKQTIIRSHSNGRRGSRQLAVKDFGVIKEDEEQAEVSGPFEVFNPCFNQYQPSYKIISKTVPINALNRRKYENHIDQSHCSRTQ